MNWMITIDYIGEPGDTDVGKGQGIGNAPTLARDLFKLLPFRFRLYDDDGIMYYEGRSDDRDSEAAFLPLDWAMAHAGCTRIDYLQDNGAWETL